MQKGDKSLTPHVDYTNTKAAVEATADPIEGMRAVSTDTHESGFYNGSAWVWGSGGTGGGGGYAAEVEIDFGVTGVTEATFTIIDTNVNSSSFIISQIKYKQPTGKDLDEVTMDNFDIMVVPSDGTFDMRVACLSGSVSGKFIVTYLAVL